jgi:mannitol/fructose-specific phosphotransferase system IIA component (Ntr-type)
MSLPPLNLPPVLDVCAADEQAAIGSMVESPGWRPELADAGGFLQAVMERQRINAPVLGNGIAVPHARTPLVKELVFAAARLAEPVPFGEARQPVRLVFLFGIPPHEISRYLAAMAALVKRLRDPAIREGLLAAGDAREFMRWLE